MDLAKILKQSIKHSYKLFSKIESASQWNIVMMEKCIIAWKL